MADNPFDQFDAKSYDTALDPAQEKAYRVWMTKIGHTKQAGYRVDDNFSGEDYDYRGFFQKNGPVAVGEGQHFTDEFKKPAHETFSNESKYAVGEDAAKAGSWSGETFRPAGGNPFDQFDTAQAPQDSRPVGDLGSAIMEPLGALGSGMIAGPVAGLAGLGAAGTRALGLTDAQPADVVRNVQSAMTYQPRTQAGQTATDIVGYPFEKLAQGADYVGGKVAEATGSPAAGAGTNAALQLLPSMLIPALKGKAKPAEVPVNGPRTAPADIAPGASTPKPAPADAAPAQRTAGPKGVPEAAPSLEELKRLKDAAYKRADDSGVTISEGSLKGLKARIAKEIRTNKTLHPDATAAIKEIFDTKGELTLSKLDELRQIASDAKGSPKPADSSRAAQVVEAIDEFVENLSDKDVTSGKVQDAAALKEARGYYTRLKKSEDISELFRRAEIKAGANYTQSGLENALRGEFKALALNKQKLRRFNQQERAAIERVAKGAPLENALRYIGKLAPTGTVSGMLGAIVSAAVPGGVALPIAGVAGRAAATRMTLRNAQAAEELMRRGRTLEPEKKRNKLAEPLTY